ncbi:LPXTG cell wall anchor domain-containing protein [Micromonospora tarensis]|uniref:LPXTG cell wall anchor domain-containing protein n=1 Tax=Micromonospora tarensis TaxID=2806100 RepID=A0ABS1YGA5_9ACTN|nr:LPXTG cell wall anchor domain-containing protein [Micromonospora tarensis]MBM0276442.1 LPXTG cell wall anchor domain-containing protein [Micromonospora tarensis]
MRNHSTRRWLAGLGVAGAFVAASATPVSAAPAEEFELYANNLIVAAGGPEKWVSLYSFVDQPFTDYTVTVDRSAVSGFADVQEPEGYGTCTAAGAMLTCTVKGDPEPDLDLLTLAVVPRAGAQAGEEGELAFTVTTPESGTATFRSTVAVGEGVDLAAEHFVQLDGKPGGTVKAPLSVANRGDKVARGSVLFFFGSYGFTPTKRYENCQYAADDYDDNAFACTFDTDLEPGEAARLDSTFGFSIPADSWAPNNHYGYAAWYTPADWQEFRSQVGVAGDLGPKGDAPALKLEPVAPSRSRALGQTDVDPYNNEMQLQLEVKGDQKADVAAIGATVSAQVGETVAAKVGYTNNGPAAIGVGGDGGVYTGVVVTVPVGTTAVTVPETCDDLSDTSGNSTGKPGAAAYVCFTPDRVKPGERVDFEFGLRVDRAGALAGTIELRHAFGDNEAEDLNAANDTAQILVNANGGQGGGNGGGDGDGGSLPITGQSTGLIAGLGAVLLAAGVGGYLAAKRRRTRFVA